MKIERIDDKTVKCFLSNEELEEYDIDYKDFVTRSDKAKDTTTRTPTLLRWSVPLSTSLRTANCATALKIG